ncbi:conserved fungal hypothetical protein [Sugiyamaella lignohabitans]|uniref:Uncharacterized protein n=1 Tax=Sugiyamaella lignohabitans TaxID=796027 RepID=A0A167D6C3_9ASCO|nr:conserved fungal hypothetical protein [Sugiyamaella lignohabitans]ANB12536.1 conserved fungal hypothetical protein [Sugiyamaella lignohabitans]
MGYVQPVGGYTKIITPTIGVHGAPFFLFNFLPFASTSAAIKLQSPGNPIVVTNPTPWGDETNSLLRELSGITDPHIKPNVKYLIALDNKHFLAIKGWTQQFPDATVIGMDGLLKKTEKPDGGHTIKFDILFGSKNLHPDLPTELASEFDTIFFPNSETQELALFHKPTNTLFTADLFPNLPAHRAFEKLLNQSGNGFFWKFFQKHILTTSLFSVDGRLAKNLITKLAGNDKQSAQELLDLNVDRIIMCHGDYIEQGASEVIHNLLTPLVKKGN